MLWVHQAPRSVTPSKGLGGERPASRTRRSSGQRRPSSAVGGGGGGSSAEATQTRRAQVAERVSGPPSRPGSATPGHARAAFHAGAGSAPNRPVTPPASARAYAAHADAGDRGIMPTTRPVTPMSRHSQGGGRSGSQSGNGRSSTPSGGAASLPLHVSTVGRPRTPTSHRRGGGPPALGGAGDRGDRGSGKELVGSLNIGDSVPTTRPDSSSGFHGGSSGAGGSASSASGAAAAPGNGSLTTVISSALDYKRFLDRRKQMIQQQVENAQQASAVARQQYQQQQETRAQAPAEPPAQGEGSDSDNGDGGTADPAHGVGTTGVGTLGGVPSGWSPGAVGPVKANHAVGAAAASALTGESPTRTRSKGALAPLALGGILEPGLAKEDSAGEDGGSGRASGAMPVGSGTAAAQQLLRRVSAGPGQQPPPRASTPTRYTQSASGATAAAAAGPGDSIDASRPLNASLPAGAGRQACRSLGQTAAGEMLARAEFTGTPEPGGTEDFNYGGESTPGASAGTLGAAPRRQRTKTEGSVDDLLRDDGDGKDPDAPTRHDSKRGSNGSNCGTILQGTNVEDYAIGKQVGAGAYAAVCFGLHKETNRRVAIKIYEKYKLLDPQRRKSVRCEIRLMERLRHPNIILFHEALDTPKQIYLVMEFVGGGSMHHYLKKRPGRRLEDQGAKRLFYQTCMGLKYLHDRHIVHRDIKLENILMTEAADVKIIDFGFSTIVPPGKKLKIFCGTPSYMSPEIVARKEYSGYCADIWAMGVLLYALLCGSFPFRGQNDRDLYRKVVRGVYITPDHVESAVRSLMSRMLVTDMGRRPSIDEVLADQWLFGHKDELYAPGGKLYAPMYAPNSSTSSTATTAAPSSSPSASAGQSRDPAADAGAQAPLRGGAVAAANAKAPSAVATPAAAVAPAAPATPAPPAAPPSRGTSKEAMNNMPSAAVDAGARGSQSAAGGGSGEPQRDEQQRNHQRLEEEAIAKLERLGYPKEEILRQLKDESSHLCKLYHRFLKALTAWDSKK